MKITFFIGGLIGGGAERVTCNLSNYLVSKGYEVQILTMSETDSYPLRDEIIRKCLLEQRERGNVVHNYIKRYIRLKSFLKSDNSDCYIVMLPITIILLLMLKKYVKAPVIASERCYPPILPMGTQKMLLLLAKRATAWVFQTDEQKLWYGDNINGCLTCLIPNAANLDFLRHIGEKRQTNTIVAVGRLSSSKNYDLLIRSFAKIANEVYDYQLVIYGEGELRQTLELLIEQLDMRGRILLPGYEKNIYEKIYNSSLYVLSSNNEGIPNTLIEAMSLGVPSISTDCDGGGARMLINNDINGILVPKKNVDALANAMKQMLLNKSFAEECGRNAIAIRETLAPEKIYGEWESFIKSVIGCG